MTKQKALFNFNLVTRKKTAREKTHPHPPLIYMKRNFYHGASSLAITMAPLVGNIYLYVTSRTEMWTILLKPSPFQVKNITGIRVSQRPRGRPVKE